MAFADQASEVIPLKEVDLYFTASKMLIKETQSPASLESAVIQTHVFAREELLSTMLQSLKVAEHSFLVPMRYCYFETTGSWEAKIGKVQVQLKKIVF